MSTTRIAASGPVALAEAWNRYEDPTRWAQWAPHISSVRADRPRLAAGMTGTVTGLGVARVRFRVLSVDRRRHAWTWRVWAGPVTVHLVHELFETADGCRATLTSTGPCLVVGAYLPLASWALHRLVGAGAIDHRR